MVDIECAFVDQIGPGESVLLDLNDETGFTLGDYDFTPPRLRRAFVDTLLVDGQGIPASAYENRTIRLGLAITAADRDACVPLVQALVRELDKPRNVLRVRLDTSNYIYFRTFRAPDFAYTSPFEFPVHLPVLSLLADPFALGEVQVLGPYVIYNDPTAVSNGRYTYIDGIVGDVETPCVIEVIDGYDDTDAFLVTMGTRRHGDATLVPPGLLASAFTSDEAGTTLGGHIATFAGAGANSMETDFSVSPALLQRMHRYPMVPTTRPENNGQYRLFVRASTDAGTVAGIRFRIGRQVGELVNVAATLAEPAMHDLGVFSLPSGDPNIPYGYLGAANLAADLCQLDLQAVAVSGTGKLYWNYTYYVPAEEELCTVLFGVVDNTIVQARPTFDSINNHAYIVSSATHAPTGIPFIAPTNPATQREGGLPFLTPGIKNRLTYINRGQNGPWEAVGDSQTIRVLYWPRFVVCR